jgi:addiction module RelE/StbE family toxin
VGCETQDPCDAIQEKESILILEWLPTAKQDFEDIVEYIAADNPVAAIEQGDEIEEQIFLLTSYPKIGRPGRVKGTRELVIVRTPYIAAYRIKGKTIQILRVLHGAQQWPTQIVD